MADDSGFPPAVEVESSGHGVVVGGSVSSARRLTDGLTVCGVLVKGRKIKRFDSEAKSLS